MAALRDVLNKFKAVKDVEMAAIVSLDGMQLDSFSKGNLDVDSICAIATTGLQMSVALGHETERGDAKQTVLEYSGGAIVLEPLTEETMMLVVSSDPNSIGKIRYLGKKYRQLLIDALGE